MPNSLCDVWVVGSGPGGGIATYALTKAGLKVTLVEAGPRLRPGIDYNAHGSPYAHLEERLKRGHLDYAPELLTSVDRFHPDHACNVELR